MALSHKKTHIYRLFVLFCALIACALGTPPNRNLEAPFLHGAFRSYPKNWLSGGSVVWDQNKVFITSLQTNRVGYVWNTDKVESKSFDMDVSMSIHGAKLSGGDGMAVWLSDRMDQGTTMGGPTRFVGTAIIIDDFPNSRSNFNLLPRLQVFSNDGTIDYSVDDDNMSNEAFGCRVHFRNAPEFTVRVTIKENRLRLQYKTDGAFVECGVGDVVLPEAFHVGVTAATGDVADIHQLNYVKMHVHDEKEKEKENDVVNNHFSDYEDDGDEETKEEEPAKADNELVKKIEEKQKEMEKPNPVEISKIKKTTAAIPSEPIITVDVPDVVMDELMKIEKVIAPLNAHINAAKEYRQLLNSKIDELSNDLNLMRGNGDNNRELLGGKLKIMSDEISNIKGSQRLSSTKLDSISVDVSSLTDKIDRLTSSISNIAQELHYIKTHSSTAADKLTEGPSAISVLFYLFVIAGVMAMLYKTFFSKKESHSKFF
ncbi:hypothetical protein PCE1_003121 [Barthelona sp. PCE]